MKNKINPIFGSILFLIVLLTCSCEKSEIMTIDPDNAGIAFFIVSNGSATDSLSYSFAYNTSEIEKDTVFINMRLTGETKPFDREIGVEAAEGTTAVLGKDFELPKIILPAGASTVKYPLVLFNTPALLTDDLRILLKVTETKDLKIGALGREIGTSTIIDGNLQISATTVNTDRYLIKFNNKLSEPDYWAELQYYGYGTFSITKFQFMLKILGTEKMDVVLEWNYNQTIGYLVQMQNALADYEAANGPMVDENGLPVVFE